MTNFEWDSKKNKLNKLKHKIPFEEAETVFFDNYALYIDDPDHSENENRYIIVGLSEHLKIIIVNYCYRKSDSIIRIFSARYANKYEQKRYWGQRT